MATFLEERVEQCIRSDKITVVLACAGFDKSSMSCKRALEAALKTDQDVDLISLEVDGDEDATEVALSLSMGSVPMARIFGRQGFPATTLTKAEVEVETVLRDIENIRHGRVSQNCCPPTSCCDTSSNCCGEQASNTSCCAAPPQNPDEILKLVQSSYSQGGCCVSVDSTQCGYSVEDLAIAAGANLGLGCGNPLSFAELKEGEVVVDLGSGAGIDCLIAAKQVGSTGRVIGIDMTPDMIHAARENAKSKNSSTVSFRLGEIEYLPVADNTADCVISNCVINLSPDKPQVFREIYRILKPGGRVAVCDVITRNDTTLPESLRTAQALAC